MTNKLSILAAKQRLLAETEASRVKAVKLALSTRKAGEVSPPRITDKVKTTKITQITVSQKDVRNTPAKSAQSFSKPPSASSIVDSTPSLKMKSGGDGGAPSKPSISTGVRPNQSAKFKIISKPINDKATTDGGTSTKSFIPASKGNLADFAYGQKAGTFVSTNNNTPTVKKQKPEMVKTNSGAPTTSPKMSHVKAGKDMPAKSVGQIKHKGGFIPEPSEGGPRSVKVASVKSKAVNIVESGVNVVLDGKVKAHFEIVSPEVLSRMVESYARHGMKLEVVRSDAAWKKDKALLNTLWESMDAQYNGVDSEYSRLRLDARNRFKVLVQGSYNKLYENRDKFLKLIDEAFKRVELNARKRYVEGLELMTCKARVTADDGQADMEIVTEAHTDQMALRQVRNKLMEMYGLDIQINHIFVDGTKYDLADIEPWTAPLTA